MLETVVVFGVGVPIVGLLMGGIYWLTALLSFGLSITIFGVGYLAETTVLLSIGAWGFSVMLLLVVRRWYGNLERFGLVHAVGLMIAFVLAAAPDGILRNA